MFCHKIISYKIHWFFNKLIYLLAHFIFKIIYSHTSENNINLSTGQIISEIKWQGLLVYLRLDGKYNTFVLAKRTNKKGRNRNIFRSIEDKKLN